MTTYTPTLTHRDGDVATLDDVEPSSALRWRDSHLAVQVAIFGLIEDDEAGAALRVRLTLGENGPGKEELRIPAALVHVGETLEETATRLVDEVCGKPTTYLDGNQVGRWLSLRDGPRAPTLATGYLAIASPPTDFTEPLWVPAHTATTHLASHDCAVTLTAALEHLDLLLQRTTVAPYFLPEVFTVAELRRAYEAIWNTKLDPGNFQRAVLHRDGLLAHTDLRRSVETGRPPRLYTRGNANHLKRPLNRDYL